MPYKKGFDRNRNAEQIFRPGDGKKRGLFVDGDDPRRISNERLQEVNFKDGNMAWTKRDVPLVTAKRVDVIPQQFQVEISPATTGKELLPMLDDAIEFGERMMGLIVAGPRAKKELEPGEEEAEAVSDEEALRRHLATPASVENALAVGLYTELLAKCIKTRGEIEGGGIKPAAFGKLAPEAAEQMKEELAFLLHCDLTKLNHGLHYCANHDIFDKNGVVRQWANKSFRALISATRAVIETRARLDLWESKQDRGLGAIEAAYREAVSGPQ